MKSRSQTSADYGWNGLYVYFKIDYLLLTVKPKNLRAGSV